MSLSFFRVEVDSDEGFSLNAHAIIDRADKAVPCNRIKGPSMRPLSCTDTEVEGTVRTLAALMSNVQDEIDSWQMSLGRAPSWKHETILRRIDGLKELLEELSSEYWVSR